MSESETIGEVVVKLKPVMDQDELRRVVEEAVAKAQRAASSASSAAQTAGDAGRMSWEATTASRPPGGLIGPASPRGGIIRANSPGVGDIIDVWAGDPQRGYSAGGRTLTTPLANLPALPFAPLAGLEAEIAATRAENARQSAEKARNQAAFHGETFRNRADRLRDELGSMGAIGPDDSRRTVEGRQKRLREMMAEATTPDLEELIGREYARNLNYLQDMAARDGLRKRFRRKRARTSGGPAERDSCRPDRSLRFDTRRRGTRSGMGGGGRRGGAGMGLGAGFPDPFGNGGQPPVPTLFDNSPGRPVGGGNGNGGGLVPPLLPPGPGDQGRPSRRSAGRSGGGFLSAPSGMGLYMSLMFGGWEVSNAVQAYGEANRAGFYYPDDMARQFDAQIGAIDQMSGGIIGSVAGFITDPFRSRNAAARAISEAGGAGNRLVALRQVQADRAAAEELSTRARRATGPAKRLVEGLVADRRLASEQSAEMEERRAIDSQTAAGDRAAAVGRIGDAIDAGAASIDPRAGFVVSRFSHLFAETFMGDQVDAMVSGMSNDRRSKLAEMQRKDRLQRRRGLSRSVEDLHRDLVNEIDDMGDARAYGPVEGGLRARERVYDRTVSSSNELLDIVGDKVESLGFGRPDFSQTRGMLESWRAMKIQQDREAVQYDWDTIGNANKAETSVLEYANVRMPYAAQREAVRQSIAAERRDLRRNAPTLSDEQFEAQFGIGAKEKAQLRQIDIAEKDARTILDINLDMREAVADAFADVRGGRRSRYAPNLESVYGRYRSEAESLRQSGFGDQIPRLQELFDKDIEAIKSQFFDGFRPTQVNSLGEVDTSGKEFGRIMSDFDAVGKRRISNAADARAGAAAATMNSYDAYVATRYHREAYRQIVENV